MPIPFLIGLGIAAVAGATAVVGAAAVVAAYEIITESLDRDNLEHQAYDVLYEHREAIGQEITLRVQRKEYNEVDIGLFSDTFEDTLHISANEISDDIYVGYETKLTLY